MRYAELIEKAQELSGLYVAAYFTDETNDDLSAFKKSLKIPNPTTPDDFHTTIVYSKKLINWRAEHDVGKVATPTGWQIWPSQSKEKFVLVLLIESEYLRTRFKLSMDRGATFDFPDYNPHISFSYNVGPDFDASDLPLPDFDLIIDCERAERLSD